MTENLLKLLLESAAKAVEYASVPFQDFLKDGLRQDAVAFRLIVIGELVKRVPEDVKAKFPEVPWKKAAGIRDFLAHEGHHADPEVLWYTASKLLPSQIITPLSSA